jgi:hypothetical protein
MQQMKVHPTPLVLLSSPNEQPSLLALTFLVPLQDVQELLLGEEEKGPQLQGVHPVVGVVLVVEGPRLKEVQREVLAQEVALVGEELQLMGHLGLKVVQEKVLPRVLEPENLNSR